MATPDYLADKFSASVLARKIEAYYHKRGRLRVRVWVEPIEEPTRHWAIRSNIRFDMSRHLEV